MTRYPLESLVVGDARTYDVRANYKVVLENYNECYHCAGVHPELVRLVPAFGRGGADLDWEDGIPHREGAWTFTACGTTSRAPFAGLDEHERVRHKGELLYPNLMLSLSADHVAAFVLWPTSPDRTRIVCDVLVAPEERAKDTFDASDAMDFWDTVNRQDWAVCESVQRGHVVARLHAGLVRADGGRQPGHPALAAAAPGRVAGGVVVSGVTGSTWSMPSSWGWAGSGRRRRGSWPGAECRSWGWSSSSSGTCAARRTTRRGSCAAATTRRATCDWPARRTTTGPTSSTPPASRW